MQKIKIFDGFMCICLPARFTGSLMFYGLSLNSGRLAGDVFLNTFLLSVVEVPANLLCLFLLDRIGRRNTVGGGMLTAAALTLGCIPFLIFEGDCLCMEQ